MNKKVFVFSESVGNACEMLTGAKTLGDNCSVILVGNESDAAELIAHGAQKVFLFEKEKDIMLEAYADDISKVVAEEKPALFMVGMTNRGRTIAAMVAQAIQAPCVSECKSITTDAEGRYVLGRKIYSGMASTSEVCTSGTLVVTLPMRTYEAETADTSLTGEIIRKKRESECKVKLVEVRAKAGDSVDVSAADTVVLFGRGVAKQEDMPMIEELTAALGGVTACTRPIAVDYKWMPISRYIGLSGKSVKPKLYLDIGSSGQIQQIAGAQDAKIIVAINNNPSEPVFNVCDYAVAGDLYEAVPILTKLIKALH